MNENVKFNFIVWPLLCEMDAYLKTPHHPDVTPCLLLPASSAVFAFVYLYLHVSAFIS